MLLPIQPRTVKPKIYTIASMIRSRFTLASCPFAAGWGRRQP